MGICASLACCAAECACCALCRGLCACCGGGGKDAKANPNAGRVGSLWVMLLAIILSLAVQYTTVVKHLDFYAWDAGCDTDACKEAAGVYRVSACTALFFALMGLAGYLAPEAHDGHWSAKFGLWLLLLVVSVFTPNYVFSPNGWLWVARVGGFAFVILQQVLLIDFAYYCNDSLVALADTGEVDDWCGMPSPLVALLAAAAVLFGLALVGLAMLFVVFGTDCTQPDVILGLTVVLVVLATACQLFVSKDSNLLTSSVVAAYLVYLAASALTANPRDACNPFHNSSKDWLSIAVGLGFTLCALAYTVYSASSQVKYLANGREVASNAPGGSNTAVITGQVSAGEYGASGEAREPEAVEAGEDAAPDKTPGEVLSFNVIMALMACQVAMVLTNWGSLQSSGSPSAPSAGKVSMWIQAAAQWTAGLLYIWTCVAPTLFPDRDFS